MMGASGTGVDDARPSRKELQAENARLRAMLARAGVDAKHATGETVAAREETRKAHSGAADAAAGHASELEAGRAELAGSEGLNETLRRTNAALAESEDRYRAVLASATDYAIFTMDRQWRITGWNEGARRILGWSEAEVLGCDARMIWTPEDREAGVPEAEAETCMALDQGTAVDDRWHMQRDGSRFWAQGQLTPLHDGAGGQPRGFLKILRDRTALRAAGRERERLLAMLSQSQTMVCDWDGRIEVWSLGMERLFGYLASEAVGAITWELMCSEYPAPWQEIVDTLQREGRWVGEARHRAKDGSSRMVQATWLVQPGLDGAPSSLVVAEEDQTAVKEAEERLREGEAALRHANDTLEARVDARTAELRHAVDALHAEALEREQAEAQLRQAQKMEAVGQLTGGIAHDFNNMLQAIAGSLELLGRRVEQGRAAEAGRYVEAARIGVERAAALTHRLLAFARRQTLQPGIVNPDRLVEGLAELMRRTVGPSVAVELRLYDDTWPVLCDPHQLESVLLNLVINARDAMAQPSSGQGPGDGRLTISTRHVSLAAADVADQEGALPGEYVELAVADTGAGMDDATKARAFEPFFTTKPLGQGTGLGLSQLHGFVRQSCGAVRLDSAPGQGTTVRLYLPRHGQDGADTGEAGTDPAGTALAAGVAVAGGTVLLVEDEAAVRAVAAEHLRELGYAVLEAADGPEALCVLHGSSSGQVDALVTDVGLPNGMNGRQLADLARERRPGLPVLFVTGYAGGVLEEQLAPGMMVISKPFALDALGAKVQAMVGSPHGLLKTDADQEPSTASVLSKP